MTAVGEEVATGLEAQITVNSEEEVHEVVGEEKKLLNLIANGTVVITEAMSWNDWQKWRTSEGPHRRPIMSRDGKTVS